MMKKTAVLLLFVMVCALPVSAQTNSTLNPVTPTDNIPQWVKDLRRGEIILFGSFPFAMFTVTFAMDMYRWNNAYSLDFSDEGRRYAPWPLKSAGAIAMESSEQELTIGLAVGLAALVAVTDQIIVQVKRYNARKKAEALPAGATIINRSPLPDDTQEIQEDEEEAGQTEQEP